MHMAHTTGRIFNPNRREIVDRCDMTEEELITARSLLSEKKSSSDGQMGLFRASCLGFRTGGTDKEFSVSSEGGGRG